MKEEDRVYKVICPNCKRHHPGKDGNGYCRSCSRFFEHCYQKGFFDIETGITSSMNDRQKSTPPVAQSTKRQRKRLVRGG